MEEFEKRRRNHILLLILEVILIFVLVLAENKISAPVTTVLTITFIGAIILSYMNWKCPNCNKYLGKSLSHKFCPHCGEQLS